MSVDSGRTLLSMASMIALPAVAQQTQKPNVVVIVADDMGTNEIGCYGGQNISTPNIDRLADEGIRVNMTLCFTVPQAILAARAGARYISPFVGRFDDISEDGLSQLENVVTAINNYDYSENTVNHEQVEIIAASIRSANHVTQAALMGADIATVPFNVLKKMIQHPLTDRGLESFLKDWEKVANA